MITIVTLSAASLFTVPASACDLTPPIGCEPDPEEPPEVPAPPPEPDPALPVEPPAVLPPDTDAAEARLLVLINDDRRSHGLVEVTARSDVEEIADAHSAAMAAQHDIWHNDSYFTGATKRRLGAARVGENVALNRDADDAHRKLMASPLHRANILDAGFTVVGIAAAADEEGRLYITEDFLEPVRVASVATRKAVRVVAPAATPAPRPQVSAPVAIASAKAPDVMEVPQWNGEGFELALGPKASLPKQNDAGSRPWVAYLLAVGLLGAATVGLRRVAC